MTALTIAGSDSGGGAGLQADIKTFFSLGVHGVCVVTSITAQNTLGVRDVFDLPASIIKAQFKALHEDFDIKAAKTGMLSSKGIVKTVARELGDYPLVVDPVMVAQTGGRLLDSDAIEILRKRLFPKALVVTPNIPEAEVLSGLKIKNREDIEKACEIISSDCSNVLIKGGHLDATDVLYVDGKFREFTAKKLGDGAHGSGCTFASAITAELAKGEGLISAVENAKRFITEAIKTAYKPGKGVKVVNQSLESIQDSMVVDTSEKQRIVKDLRLVVKEIEGNENFPKLIPEVGVNIAYALPDAKKLEDIAAISGRIVRIEGKAKAVRKVKFGASKHVATIVLTAMRFDSSMRSSMNIRYSDRAIERCRDIGLKISSFSRSDEPKAIATMEWGTEQAIKKLNAVPDIIYDLGAIGKEPMIRILGKSPKEVFEKANKILKGI